MTIRDAVVIAVPAAYWVALFFCTRSWLEFTLYTVFGVPLMFAITGHYAYRFHSPGFEDYDADSDGG